MKELALILAFALNPAFARDKKIEVPDCMGRYLVEINTEAVSKEELLTILYKASGPNHPSYISPAGGFSFMGAGSATMSLSLNVAKGSYLKMSRAEMRRAAKTEISGIAALKGVMSIRCY